MEPRIQYAKTEDGVSIAFWTIGRGPPLVRMPNIPWSHIQFEWERMPDQRAVAEAASERFTYVRYDCRGAGSSSRDVNDFSLEAHLLDLTAVLDRLGLERFALLGANNSGPVAVAYAAREPQRVSHLILWDSYARAVDALATPEGRAFRALREQDWTIYTETVARIQVGWTGEAAREGAAYFREATTQEAALAAHNEVEKFDVTDLLHEIRIPTLVVKSRLRWPSVEASRSLAAQIPDARLVITEDMMSSAVAIGDFLAEVEGSGKEAALPQGTAIILFLDIADSTALTTKLGDAAYREKERELDTALRAAITGAGGTAVEGKVLGDGVMAVFTSARQAIDAAQKCRVLGDEASLPLHLGIHAGDVVREVDSNGRANVHGGAVQVASRVQSAAAPGEILVSATVRDLARTSAGVEFEDRGEHALKGIAEPQRLFAVREQS